MDFVIYLGEHEVLSQRQVKLALHQLAHLAGDLPNKINYLVKLRDKGFLSHPDFNSSIDQLLETNSRSRKAVPSPYPDRASVTSTNSKVETNSKSGKSTKSKSLKAVPSPHSDPASLGSFKLGKFHTLTTCPITSTNKKVEKARQTRYDARLGEVTRQLVGNSSPAGDQYMKAFLKCSVGKRQFPKTSANIRSDEHLQQMAKNLKHFVFSMGKHNARIGIRFLTEGLPTMFLKNDVGLTDKQLGKRKVDQKVIEDPYKHSLCMQDYAADVSRDKILPIEKAMVHDFFNGSTAVFSGTDRRCVESTLHDWESKVTHTSRDHNQLSSQSRIDRNPPSITGQ
jgi:hypothetical protein